MTSQPDLFDAPARYPNTPGHRGVGTSIAAAEAIKPHVGRIQLEILKFLKVNGSYGATREEIDRGCRLKTQTTCGRMPELTAKGWATKTERTRHTRACVSAHVYVITEAGRKVVEAST